MQIFAEMTICWQVLYGGTMVFVVLQYRGSTVTLTVLVPWKRSTVVSPNTSLCQTLDNVVILNQRWADLEILSLYQCIDVDLRTASAAIYNLGFAVRPCPQCICHYVYSLWLPVCISKTSLWLWLMWLKIYISVWIIVKWLFGYIWIVFRRKHLYLCAH